MLPGNTCLNHHQCELLAKNKLKSFVNAGWCGGGELSRWHLKENHGVFILVKNLETEVSIFDERSV